MNDSKNKFAEVTQEIKSNWSSLEIPTPDFIAAFSNLPPFQNFLLHATLFPRHAHASAETLVRQTLRFDLKLAAGRLETALEHSMAATPVVCVLGAGVDISRPLFALAAEQRTKLLSVSMAAEQTEYAEAAVAHAMAAGTWICLHNCHLTGEWLNRLERISFNDALPSFRLWLTCCQNAQVFLRSFFL